MKWFRKDTEMPESARSDEWDQTRSYDPMEVVRLDDGSLDPPLDQTWDDATRLQWGAGMLKADTGFAVTFYQPSSGWNGKVDWAAFGMLAPGGTSCLSSIRADDFWLFSVGVGWGIRWAKNQAGIDDE